MKSHRAACFLAAEGALYALFLSLDLLGRGNTTPLKFAAILLVALAGLGAGKGERIVTAALLLTALADVFLLLLDRCYALGVALFLAVQVLYALRLTAARGGAAWAGLLLRALPALAAAAALGKWGLLTALPGAYIAVFAVNLLAALALCLRRREGKWTRFFLGLALFFCCDLCVGAHNLPAALLPGWLPGFARVAMWGFYLPGQVLILSSTNALGGKKA